MPAKQFKLTFKLGLEKLAEVTGREDIPPVIIGAVTYSKLIETEQFLEKLTGLRVHIEQVQ